MVRALRQAAGIGPYFTVRTEKVAASAAAEPPWHPVAALYGPGVRESLAPLITTYQALVGGGEQRVAASLLYQGYAARLFSPVLATAAFARRIPDLDPDLLHWRYVDGRPIDLLLPEPTGWQTAPGVLDPAAPLAAHIYDTVVGDHLAPLAVALRSTVRISGRLLWGNAASALTGAARMLAHTSAAGAAHRITTELLERGVLRGTGAWQDTGAGQLSFVRRSCCLYYRVPGGGTCLDCVFRPGTAAPRVSGSPLPAGHRRRAGSTRTES